MSAQPTYRDLETRIQALAREIEIHQAVEKDLQTKVSSHETLLKNIPDVVYSLDSAAKIASITLPGMDFYGYEPTEIVNRDFAEFIHPEDREAVVAYFLEGVETRRKWTRGLEFRVLAKNGDSHWVEVNAHGEFDDQGSYLRSEGVIRNINARKESESALHQAKADLAAKVQEKTAALVRANKLLKDKIDEESRTNEALRMSEARYRILFDSISDAVFVHALAEDGTPGNFIEVNDLACQRLGYSRKKLLQMSPVDIGLDQQPDLEKGRQLLKDRYLQFQTVHVARNGQQIPVESNVRLFEMDDRTYALSISRDISHRRRAENEKNHLFAQLQQAQKMEAIGTLAGGIAHDFNNILFPIIGYTEMLLNEVPTGSHMSQSLGAVLEATGRARDLVKQILSFSRQADHEKKPVRIQKIVREVLQLSRHTLPSTIEISSYIKNDCGLVMADSTQIHQVVLNLVTNAFHALEEKGGQLRVTLKEVELTATELPHQRSVPGKYVCLTVVDNGPGMDRRVLDRIFGPYFTTKKKNKGTGLGLAVVDGLVKSHGGHLTVKSESGKGTAFQVYLPRIRAGQVLNDEKLSPRILKGTEHILLVDDEEYIVTLQKQMLEGLGYKVTSRTSSVEAFEVFRASPGDFDIVLTDLTMPNITGEQLARRILVIRPDIPILILTGFSERISDKQALAMGIKGFLMKPVVLSHLSQSIREALNGNSVK